MAGPRRVLATHLTDRQFYHHPLTDRSSRGEIIAQFTLRSQVKLRLEPTFFLPHIFQPELQSGDGGGNGIF